MKKQMIFFGVSLLLSCSLLEAQTWNTPVTVTTPYSGIGGYFTSPKLLVVNGYPAMVVKAATQDHLVFFRATDAAGTTWGSPVPIDVSGNVAGSISFQIVNGNPAVSYDVSGSDGNDLRYVRANDANGTTWSSPITVDVTGNVGQNCSLQVVNGNPSISYYDATNSDLKYVRATDANGTTWGVSLVVDGNSAGQSNSLQLINGNPAIAYTGSSQLKFVRATDVNGATWAPPLTVDNSNTSVGAYCSMQVVNGNPAIAYYDATNGDLKYVHATTISGTSWGSSIAIDITGNVGSYSSLQIVNNNPAISYYDQTNSSLKYIRANDISGVAWGTSVTIESLGYNGSLQIVNGNPAISYQSGNSMKYIRANDISGVSWSVSLTFNNTGNVGQYSSLKGVNGVPAISYYTSLFNGGLLYVHAADNSGTLWETPVFADGFSKGKYSSLLEVNGSPAVVYYDDINAPYRIRFRRASDANGTTWAPSVVIDFDIGSNSTNIPTRISIQIVNGNPAIAYYDDSGSGLKFKRATDVNGTAWPSSPVTINLGITTNISLQVVNGNPALIYWDGASLKYVRATDANGTSWATPVAIDTYNSGINFFRANYSLEIVNGNPAVCYTNGLDLKYARATDNNGTSWGIPVILDPTVLVNYYTSMQVVNGNPAISYYDEINRDLKYIRATDNNGTGWAAPVTLDASGDVGSHNSMSIINGAPAISYYDATNGLLKYIRANNLGSINTTFATTTICAGNGFPVNYSSNNVTFNAGNIFTAQLSNATGSFASPINIGTLSSASGSGSINVTIPANTTSGSNYRVRVISTDPVVVGDQSTSLTINAIPSTPSVSAGGATTFCQGGSVTLTSNAASGNQWYKDGVAISGSTNNTLNVTASGTYTVKVTLNGCESSISNSIAVTVNTAPATPAITAGGAISFCTGGNVTLTSNAANGNQWYKDGVALSGSTGTSLNVTTSGSYTVKVTANGCESAASNAIVVTVNAIPSTPSVSAGGVTTFCQGGSVTLTSNAASGNQWYKDGVAISGSTNNTLNVTASGTYTVKVTLNGCESSVSNSIAVTVNAAPATPTITAGGAISFCTGGNVTLTSNAASGNQWYKDGVAISGSTATTLNVTTSGSYTVKVTANGCESAASNAIVVTVGVIPSTPSISAGGVTTFCPGGNVTLTSNAASGNQWYKDGVTISGSTNTTLNVTASGTYTVKVTLNGCESSVSNSIAVTVNAAPATPTITAGGAISFCTGGNVTLTSNAASGNQWYKDGVAISGSTGTTLNVTASGSYTVKVTANGCESAASNAIVVSVNAIPSTPSISAGGVTTFCQGGTVTLTSNAASGNQWYKDGVAISGSTSTTLNVTASGTYTVKVTLNACESSASNSIAVTVNASPATPTITAGGAITFCTGGNVTLTSNAASGNQWYKDGVAISGSTGTTLNVTASGSYTVKVTANGCESAASAAVAVTVNALPATPSITQNGNQLVSSAVSGNQWYLNGVVIAGATGQNYIPVTSGNYTVQVTVNNCASAISSSLTFTVTAIPNIIVFNNRIRIFPNPVEDKLIITQSGTASQLNIRLIDYSGQQLKHFNTKLSRTEIDMTRYAAGAYIIIIEDKTRKIQGKKIVLKM